MAEKEFNHYIPRMILKHWAVFNHQKIRGVFVFDFVKDRSYFSTSKGKKGFSFAIEKDLYIPKIENERRTNLEDWFNGLESQLDRTIRLIMQENGKPLFNSPFELNVFMLALLSFKHRTKYVIEKNMEFLNQNPEYIDKVSGKQNREIGLVVLENIVNATTHDSLNYQNFEMIIGKSTGKSIIYGDVPFLENLIDGFNFLPITNKYFIAFRSIDETSTYRIHEFNDDLIDSLNCCIASNSKKWIVADNPLQIEKYKAHGMQNENSESKFVPIRFNFLSSTFD